MSHEPESVVNLEIREDGVAVVRIDRPEAKNALNSAVREQLAEHFRALARNGQVRAIVLTGGDTCFVAGADIREFAQARPIEMYLRHTELLWEAISRCPKPVIAAVNGFALGGGCELAMHCDIIVAGESARFGQPEVKLGLMPGAGGVVRMVRMLGMQEALTLISQGKRLKADKALEKGLIHELASS